MPTCNTTLEDADVSHVDLGIGITFHHLGLIIAALFGLISIVISGYLIIQHAFHYSRPIEELHIIRILFMIPIYATVSFLSYLFFKDAIYYEVLRDCYEAFALASFFTLLCNYIAPNLHEQKEFFRGVTPINWIWPMSWIQKCTGGENRGLLRKPTSGLTWFNIVYLGIFQYCFIRVFFTIVSVITQATGRYCVLSINPAFAHVWVTVFEGVSVSIAIYVLLQFYVQLRRELAGHGPKLKLACIKLVIFFSFWQTLVISFLSSAEGPLQPTATLSYPDIAIGIPSILICIEMAGFSVLYLFAFPWKIYRIDADAKLDNGPHKSYYGVWRALIDAFNPYDILKATARGFRWLFVGRRTRHLDPSYGGAWGGGGAFEGDQTGAEITTAGPTKLDTFGQSTGWTQVPTAGEPNPYSGQNPYSAQTAYGGAPSYAGGPPERSRRGQMSNEEEDDTWTSHAEVDEYDYSPSRPLQRQPSYDVGAEDRAGLLRHSQQPARTGNGPSPAGSDFVELDGSEARRQYD